MLLALQGTAGCGTREQVTDVAKSYENLQIIGLAYRDATDEWNRPPRSSDELAPFIRKRGGDPAVIFKSPDDDQPYVIHWDIDYRSPNPPVLAYEKIGKDGRRYVSRFRIVLHMTEEEFNKAPLPSGKAP